MCSAGSLRKWFGVKAISSLIPIGILEEDRIVAGTVFWTFTWWIENPKIREVYSPTPKPHALYAFKESEPFLERVRQFFCER